MSLLCENPYEIYIFKMTYKRCESIAIMIVLGIETSCDETAASVVENGKKIISNVVASQTNIHSKYGGVVPEIASRHHVRKILIQVIQQSLEDASMTLDDIDGIAVTQVPGLWVVFL